MTAGPPTCRNGCLNKASCIHKLWHFRAAWKNLPYMKMLGHLSLTRQSCLFVVIYLVTLFLALEAQHVSPNADIYVWRGMKQLFFSEITIFDHKIVWVKVVICSYRTFKYTHMYLEFSVFADDAILNYNIHIYCIREFKNELRLLSSNKVFFMLA